MTLQAGVGKETEPSLSKTGETPDFHSPGCAPCFAVLWGPPGRSLEHWLAGAGKHISISSTRSPEVSKPKGWPARESYRVFQGSVVFLLSTGSPSSVLRS